ncbi:unnamed protein product, partial [Didymodactylos carnosus]
MNNESASPLSSPFHTRNTRRFTFKDVVNITYTHRLSIADASGRQRRKPKIGSMSDPSFDSNLTPQQQAPITSSDKPSNTVARGMLGKFALSLPIIPRISTNTWFSRLIFTLPQQSDRASCSTTTAVEKQTEAAREKGTVWNAIRKANQKKLEKLLNKDQNIV